MPSPDPDALLGTWRHSHEEDSAEGTVYRRADYPFPPSRGRQGFALQADGRGEWLGLSARDGTARAGCRWRLDAGSPATLTLIHEDGREESWAVLRVSADRLVLGDL